MFGVSRGLTAPPVSGSAMKAFATFQLDPVNQCLWRKTGTGELKRILLSASEFGVLDHLTAHAGRLVTHRELLDAVWPGTAIEPQVVKSKIFHLRRALDDDPKHPRFIETLPRRGYRFVATLEAPVQLDDAQRESAGRFVGRESVLAELWRSMRSADAGRVEVVFVTGEAGIGKTALVVELQRQVALSATALRVARGQCVEGFGSKEAFYPVLDAVGELCRRFDGSPVVGTLASHAPTWLVQFPALLTRRHRETLGQEILGATRERMLREICAALEAVTASMPLLLVLEDLHWADPSTLDFISALARGGTHTRLMLVATYRPSDVARSTQPLHSLKRDLVARHLAREIVLPPLTEADVTSYLAADAGTPDDSVAIAGLLHRHTEGNPLFMTAVLQHLVERGFVERDPGGWRLRRPASEISLEVPDSLREMIAAQIERLDAEEQHVLEVGAIAGMSFAPAISAPSADMNADTFDECCDALARRAHILRLTDTQEMPDGTVMQRYAFAHALYREVLYARQSPARRAMLHRRRAERMEELFAGSLDDVTIQLAIHFEKGGDWARAVKYLRRAADVAATRSALEEARDNLQHAFDLASRLPTAERGMAETEILDTLADLYLGTFDSRAADVLALLGERAMQHGLVEAAAKALVDRVYPVAWESRDRALALVDEALSLSARAMDPLARARVQAQAFIRRIWTRGWSADDALECTRALATIRRLGTPQVVAWHAIDCNLLDLFSSRYGAAARNTIEALATLGGGPAESMYLSYAYSAREFIVPWCFILLGEWGAALRELDAGVELAEKNGDPVRAQTLLLYRAWALLHAMDFASVRAICDSLLPTIDENTHAPWRRLCLTLAGAAEAGLGDNERAFDRALTARGEMDSRPALGDWYWRLLLQRTLVDLRLAAGDLTRARAEGASFLAVARATVERTWLGLAWDANARIALAAGDAGHARGLAQRALAAIDGFETPIAAWQAHATAAQVAREHDDLASMTRHRTASRAVVLDLARRLGDRDDLRHTFLASPLVADAVGSLPPETISQPERNPFDNDSRASHP